VLSISFSKKPFVGMSAFPIVDNVLLPEMTCFNER
jgi:hypothetical protein